MNVVEDSSFSGNLNVGGRIGPPRSRTELATELLAKYPMGMDGWRIWDAFASVITGTPGTDDLGIVGAVFGTDCPYLSSGDLKNDLGVTTRYARRTFAMPAEFVAGQGVKIRVSGGMKTTIASATATVDIECYKSNRDGTKTGSDLCTTAAQSINSLSFADKDFTITGTGLNPGDELDIRIALAVNDTGTGTAVIAVAGAVELLCDIRG